MIGKFYVYVYSHPVTKVPFYVGKGSGGRYLQHLTNARNPYLKNKISEITETFSLKPLVERVLFTDNEDVAYDVEEHLIRSYGMKSQGGILCNFVLGGRNGRTYNFPDEFYNDLGKLFDREVAEKYDCSVTTVRRAREYEGIEVTRKKVTRKKSEKEVWNKITLSKDCVDLFGKLPDKELGEMFNVSSSLIGKERRKLGISEYYSSSGSNWRTHRLDNKVHSFYHSVTGESFMGIRKYFREYINCSSGQLSDVISGKNKSVKKWIYLGVLNE